MSVRRGTALVALQKKPQETVWSEKEEKDYSTIFLEVVAVAQSSIDSDNMFVWSLEWSAHGARVLDSFQQMK